MPNATRLLKQVRRALASLKHDGLTPAQDSLIGLIDFAVNELLLREDPAFYLKHFADGRNLLAEGLALVQAAGRPPRDIAMPRADLGPETRHDVLSREIRALHRALTGRRVSAYRIAYAKVAYRVLVHIGGLTTLRDLDEDDNAPIQITAIAFKLMPLFGADFDELIAEAENVKEATGTRGAGFAFPR